MARRKIEFVADYGRDKSKVFHITEMPASRAEDWAMRAIMGAIQAGVQLPEDYQLNGMAGLAAIGAENLGKLDIKLAQELFREMFECVTIKTPSGAVRGLIEDDIEEVVTRVQLRRECLAAHMDFFTPVGTLISE